MDLLKLAALDVEDLTVISACVKEAVVKTGEISYNAGEKRIVLPIKRSAWEKNGGRLSIPERSRGLIHVEQGCAVGTYGVDRKKAAPNIMSRLSRSVYRDLVSKCEKWVVGE